ncbi:NEK protein kinase [Ophiocordyceps camponoti-floridani]|uniref:non-specific serine/threonine protein kinase n=1 Tax=Ophiocordyceps camponoti-floridani TaxID=2030778 RepID=A0A8H4Q5N0_9HYPO|nr:NEK protein kinase [Ophiocordyceps camponoti-floridani]
MSEDKYETLEKIGHGSFGVIRKVRRKADGFIMCRKEISYLRMSQKEREQLHTEFQILSHLRHPNIVAYYHREHLKISQDLHLYMEYCGNGDLGRVIKDLQHKGQRAQESFVWSIFSQLVMALYRCHYGVDPPEVGANVLGLTQGNASASPKVPAGTMTILHRDLKPENVFLGEDNSVKLGDFGLSKMIKSHDFASTYVGTPFYMSPEICAAEKYTLKSDIWSLGCIIYELCVREPPFNAKTHFQLVQKIKEAKVPPLPDVYSHELGQVIRDCLRLNPDRRPDTAQLLNLPAVKLMRKEKEVVDLNRELKAREEALRRREAETEERLASLDRERDQLEASLRREWEVKARLEIDRLANAEMEQLQKRFEDEVRARVEAELQRRPVFASSVSVSEAADTSSSSSVSCSVGFSTTTTAATDMTSECQHSPVPAEAVKRNSARTPFARAQTMFAGTPMDVEMVSPSPMAIASLSLSPRRMGNAKAPTSLSTNIFADAKWDMMPTDSDDDDIGIPSPTRHIKSSKNPFTCKDRPILSTHKTTTAATPLHKTVGDRQRSPGRQLSKIPSVAGLHPESTTTAIATNPLLNRRPSTKRDPAEGLTKMAVKNNIKGRTLVELQQARAGGRNPQPASDAPPSPNKRHLHPRPTTAPREDPRRGSGGSASSSGNSSSSGSSAGSTGRGQRRGGNKAEVAAVWDPERDEMPSPFLARQRRLGRS